MLSTKSHQKLLSLGCSNVWVFEVFAFFFLRRWNVAVVIPKHGLEPTLEAHCRRRQKLGLEIWEAVDYVRETVVLLHKMIMGPRTPLISYSVHLSRSKQTQCEVVSISDDNRVRRHFSQPHYSPAAQLPHAALRNHLYTARRSVTYLQLHLCAYADRRKILNCVVFIKPACAPSYFHRPRERCQSSFATLIQSSLSE